MKREILRHPSFLFLTFDQIQQSSKRYLTKNKVDYISMKVV